MPSMIPYGNVIGQLAYQRSLAPVSVAANTVAEQSFPIPGLLASDIVYAVKPSAQAGLGVVNVRVTGNNTLAIQYVNATASPIVPSTEVYKFIIFRLDNGAPATVITF